uniref:Proteasome subunit beta n=1 Tax=Globodera rostochiensis TaxID=31243 RepID=A0A914GZP4_GLORO
MDFYNFVGKSPIVQMAKFKETLDDSSAALAAMSPMIEQQRQWNPYTSQGGTAAALAGDDFVVVASDTRLTGPNEIEILSRNCEKTHILTNKIILNSCGFYGDVLQLKRLLKLRIDHYEFVYQHAMSLEQCSEMLARMLYSRRSFPYYTGAILCGIDSDGHGSIYGYDPIGCMERFPFNASGYGGKIVQTFFENQWTFSTVSPEERKKMPAPTLERALSVMRDAFRGLSERETTTGDSVKLYWAKAGEDQVHHQTFRLRGD